jgi:hypothetical protein
VRLAFSRFSLQSAFNCAVCSYLQEKYGWSEELCAVAAFLIMTDVGNHLQPDAVYNCEQIGARSPALFSTPTSCRILHH